MLSFVRKGFIQYSILNDKVVYLKVTKVLFCTRKHARKTLSNYALWKCKRKTKLIIIVSLDFSQMSEFMQSFKLLTFYIFIRMPILKSKFLYDLKGFLSSRQQQGIIVVNSLRYGLRL